MMIIIICLAGMCNVTETGAAAENEITKQMLTRNKELEEIIKFQRETLQDQAMRIEVKYLDC